MPNSRIWLLSTDTAELHFFSNAGAVAGGYAILSHTSVPMVNKRSRRCSASVSSARKTAAVLATTSLQRSGSCILSEKHGYRWAWVDSCCIDKTSSTELSEAINSMFQWYAQAEVCYACLADVPSDCDMAAEDFPFRKNRWRTRGWTLQELIAPDIVVFLSKDWEELGMKSTLAVLLEEITRIAICMCWTAPRKTTRVEDEAYCLMGLFGVSLSTIYGEGRRAFMRLQEEILKDELDASLFFARRTLDLLRGLPKRDPHGFLLAPSPACFNIPTVNIPNLGPKIEQPYPPLRETPESHSAPNDNDPFGHVEMPRVSTTDYGVKCRFPVFETSGITVAVLLCQVPVIPASIAGPSQLDSTAEMPAVSTPDEGDSKLGGLN